MAIGERIDALSVSNLLCAWKEVGITGPFSMLRDLVVAKASEEGFFSKGCGTALVNILKASNEMNIVDADFLDCIMDGLEDRFVDLDIPWATICLKNMSQLKCEDRGMLLHHIVTLANEMHKVLKKAYATKSPSQTMKDGSFFES